ncbi:MAG: hypothetical protein MJ102_06750 [Clostridia bacterium]|nr:hypothetical protein [Clostridia bacterium]
MNGMGSGIIPNIAAAAAAFAVGTVTALLNYRLTMSALHRQSDRIAFIFALRQIFNIAVLAAVYFLTPLTGASRTWTLIACAAGLTLPNLALTVRFNGKINKGQDKTENERDEDPRGKQK